jgi:tellurite methyltransferase
VGGAKTIRFSQNAEQAVMNYLENARNVLTAFDAKPEYLRLLMFDLEHYLRFFSIKEAQRHGLGIVGRASVDNAMKQFGRPERFIKSEFKDAATLNKAQNAMLGLFESMKKKIDEHEGTRVLDAGCGWGRWIVKLHDYCQEDFEMFGVDMDRFSLSYALSLDEPLNVARSKVEYLPFGNSFFDLILCSGVIHEIKTYAGREKAIGEFQRILKPGGTLYIMDAFSTNLVLSISTRMLQHVTSRVEWLFKEAQLKAMLEKNSLTIVEVQKTRYRLFGAIEVSIVVSVKK